RAKKYAIILDDARDLDVYILPHLIDQSDSTIKLSVMTQRNKAYQRVKKLLKSTPFNKRLRACKKWVKTNHWQKKIIRHNKPLKSFAFNTLDALINIIIIKGQQPDQLDDLALHKLRIDCKKLHYAFDFFVPLYDKNIARSFIEKLKRLQDSLGEIHDAFIQKWLHQKLLQNNAKIELTSVSQQVLLQIDHTAAFKKAQLSSQLAALYNSEYPWRV
ncbi:MAG: CHAD domain-containing protein, partial [Oleiphilaceae bacterium]